MTQTKISEDVVKKCADIDNALTKLEDSVAEYLEKRPQYDQLSNLDKAREDLTTLFAVDSCYWAYLRFKGEDPSDDVELSSELKRIRQYKERIKQMEDLAKRPRYEGKTVGRFIKHALLEDAEISSAQQQENEMEVSEEKEQKTTQVPRKKRKYGN